VEQAQERKWEQERSNFPLEIIFLTPRSNEDASKQATDRGRGKLRRRHGRQELRPRDLATRPPHAYFIDAKSSETWRQTGSHAVEQNALAAALNWTAIWEMDVWYIFTDGSGTTARVGHAVLVIPRWSHDALGTAALHKLTLKTKALPLSRPRHPNPC
jgi:hypothetical protein